MCVSQYAHFYGNVYSRKILYTSAPYRRGEAPPHITVPSAEDRCSGDARFLITGVLVE